MARNDFILVLAGMLILPSLISCRSAPQTRPQPEPQPANRFQPVIDAWVQQDAKAPPPENAILFIGSSSIRLWNTLHEDFPQYDVIQRGFGGSSFADANLYTEQIVLPYHPAAVVVFEGSNDVNGGKSGQEVFEDYKQFVHLLRTGSEPFQGPIFFIGITPTESRWQHWPQMHIANDLIQKYAQQHENLYYIDAPAPFLASAPTPGGPPSPDFFQQDLLHMNAKGYELWVQTITPVLESVCPPTK